MCVCAGSMRWCAFGLGLFSSLRPIQQVHRILTDHVKACRSRQMNGMTPLTRMDTGDGELPPRCLI